jgi:UDP-glucuronate 4-epimerase
VRLIIVTGAAGFIGFHVARALASAGHMVLGLDSLNAYYDVDLKHARLAELAKLARFRFESCDLSNFDQLMAVASPATAEVVIHLAAQPGVRYSIEAPFQYEQANVRGHLSVLEFCRRAPRLSHLIYASSSSVYGDRTGGPFKEDDRCDNPSSLYAATKKTCEMMSEAYAHLYGLRQYGLRFFTVYGPWGRPDMAYWMFTEAILGGRPIRLSGGGTMARDFTFIDDIVPAIVTMVSKPPSSEAPHEIFNLGNSNPNTVLQLVDVIEHAAGQKAIREIAPAHPGEVSLTFADSRKAGLRFGFSPSVKIAEGIPRFVDWFRAYRAMAS